MPSVPSRDAVEMVEVRLAEALQAFAVLETVNAAYSDPSMPDLRISVSERRGFWHPVTLGLQTVVLTSIFALLDSARNDCATLYYLVDCMSPRQLLKLPSGFLGNLDAIRDRYKTYRHKLFAHNDLSRLSVAQAFDCEGFTWVSVKSDLLDLELAAKVLQQLLVELPVPSEQTARQMIHSFNLARVQSIRDSRAFVREVGPLVQTAPDDPSILFAQ